MKAGILYSAKDIRVGEAPLPQIKPDEVLIESKAAGICGTDQHIYRGEFEARVKYPAIQGHEFGGVIVEVGSEVKGFKPGDRVVVDPVISCHSCPACRTGHINACQTLKLLGVDLDGGYGQYVAAPASHLFRLPDSVPMQHAPMVEMYGLGHHILQRGQVQPGETVALLGAGKLGAAELEIIPAGRIAFKPIFVVRAARLEHAKVTQDTRLNVSTRKHLLHELDCLEQAFVHSHEQVI